jgi:hypothetical protein
MIVNAKLDKPVSQVTFIVKLGWTSVKSSVIIYYTSYDIYISLLLLSSSIGIGRYIVLCAWEMYEPCVGIMIIMNKWSSGWMNEWTN